MYSFLNLRGTVVPCVAGAALVVGFTDVVGDVIDVVDVVVVVVVDVDVVVVEVVGATVVGLTVVLEKQKRGK